MLISRQILWMAIRIAPIREYLLFLIRPVINPPKIVKPKMVKSQRNEKFLLSVFLTKIRIKIERLSLNIKNGPKQQRTNNLLGRALNSFVRSFRPSNRGWKIPNIPTLLTEIRNWERPRILRSSKVRKATLSSRRTIAQSFIATKTNIKGVTFYL